MWKFGQWVLTVLVGDSRCRVPVQEQGEELDSPRHVLAGSHKEDGRGGLLIKVKGYGGTMTTVQTPAADAALATTATPASRCSRCGSAPQRGRSTGIGCRQSQNLSNKSLCLCLTRFHAKLSSQQGSGTIWASEVTIGLGLSQI